MEAEKRKRLDDGEVEGRKVAKVMNVAEEDDGKSQNSAVEVVAEDEEVEEFYAILRRIHEAVKYFGKGNSGRKAAAAKPWNQSFLRTDFEGHESVDENASLDLNADPDFQQTCPNGKS